MTTYCDVNTCEDCPRYGDDCDGDKRVEHTDLISRADAIEAVDNTDWYHINKNGEMVQGATSEMEAWYKAEDIYKALESLPSAELTLQTPQTYGKSINPSNAEVVEDYISRADAIEAVCKAVCEDDVSIFPECDQIKYCDEIQALLALPSADTEPKRVLQGYCKGANTIQTIRHEELTQIANTRKAVESADAVQGEWIWRTDIPIGDGRTSAGYICSNCGKDYWHGNVFNYCPSCGAIMDRR